MNLSEQGWSTSRGIEQDDQLTGGVTDLLSQAVKRAERYDDQSSTVVHLCVADERAVFAAPQVHIYIYTRPTRHTWYTLVVVYYLDCLSKYLCRCNFCSKLRGTLHPTLRLCYWAVCLSVCKWHNEEDFINKEMCSIYKQTNSVQVSKWTKYEASNNSVLQSHN